MSHREDSGLAGLAADVTALRTQVQAAGDALFADWAPHIHRAEFRAGAQNLADYLALRQNDLGALQDRLSLRGLSSLGRAEARIRPTLAALCATLDRLSGQTTPPDWPADDDFAIGLRTISAQQEAFFGPHPSRHGTRILVTLPTEAADDPALIAGLLDAGAQCLRINCAHDGPEVWGRMIAHIRACEVRLGRRCPVIMDLGGPKIRIEAVHTPVERLHRGDQFRMVTNAAALKGALPAMTLSYPHLLTRVSPGDSVLIDDGKIVAKVIERDSTGVTLQVTAAREKGVKPRVEKGVNFPSLDIDIAALTDEDRIDLAFVAQHADAIGYSFVQRPEDVDLLLAALADLRPDAPPMPIMLKIETALAVRNLPRLLVAAGGRTPVSVMIARGDLASEVGPARLSEVQEEILWLCEAAHVPVVWATQVLETLVKEGVPTRAEITDAAMGQRAECVMLNKGPFVTDGVAFLSGILRRMDRHQVKKSARLSPLTSWRGNQAL